MIRIALIVGTAALVALLALALAGCGDRPIDPPTCIPGLDGGPAWCETAPYPGAVPTCGECPPR